MAVVSDPDAHACDAPTLRLPNERRSVVSGRKGSTFPPARSTRRSARARCAQAQRRTCQREIRKLATVSDRFGPEPNPEKMAARLRGPTLGFSQSRPAPMLQAGRLPSCLHHLAERGCISTIRKYRDQAVLAADPVSSKRSAAWKTGSVDGARNLFWPGRRRSCLTRAPSRSSSAGLAVTPPR
jgi:hypothetical protein